MALLSAAALAGYILLGASLRQELPVATYTAPLYAASGLLLILAAAVRHTGLPPLTLTGQALLVGLAVLPTRLGHTVPHWALRYLPSPVISVAFLGEPAGAALLAALLLQEVPTTATTIGGIVCLIGIAGVVLESRRLDLKLCPEPPADPAPAPGKGSPGPRG